MNNKRVWFGVGLSVFFIYLMIWKPDPGSISEQGIIFALFGTPRLDFGAIWSVLGQVNLLIIGLAFFVTPAHILIRAHRWVIMLKPIGKLSVLDAYSLELVGQVANSVLPLRIGEFARGVLLGKRMKISGSTGIATVVVERLLDVICALLLTVIVGLVYPFPEQVKQGAIAFGVMVSVGLGLMIYLAVAQDPLKGILGRLIAFLPVKWNEKVHQIVAQFATGFTLLKASGRSGVVIFIESLGIWLLYALQVYLVIWAFNFPQTYPQIGAMPMLTSLVILVISAMVLSVPSAPGGMGTFHAGMLFGLNIFAVPADPAAGFALVIHAITVLGYTVFGAPFLWREGIKLADLKNLHKEGE